MNKKIIIPTLALALIATAGTMTVKSVYAQGPGNGFQSLIKKFIERFNLNEDEVNEFMEEIKEEKREEQRSHLEEQLNAAVSEGKLTEEQKNALLEKMAERPENKENWQELSEEERKQLMDNNRAEMQAWAEENGIDLSLMHPEIHPNKEGFGGRRMKMGEPPFHDEEM
ncbi:hypothetical protein JXA34_04230 [Patescibacteria group bacterium]|nr:hypothetical protein [Patescibacteria group bacterium]